MTVAISPDRERRDSISRALDRIERLGAALDFARSALRRAREYAPASERENLDAVIRIANRAKPEDMRPAPRVDPATLLERARVRAIDSLAAAGLDAATTGPIVDRLIAEIRTL